MEGTRINLFKRMSDFVLSHKIIIGVLTTIFVVALTGGVAFGSMGMSTEDATSENIDGGELIPIQQGTTTKVNFLPAYNGDTPPCNFYKKQPDGTYTQITDITDMNSLANKIREARPENVYTDGQGVTFYGTYDTKWRDAFSQSNGSFWSDRKDFLQSFKDKLLGQDLPCTHVYSNDSNDWGIHKASGLSWLEPKLSEVYYGCFYNAYKLGDSTYKEGDPNLLSPEVYQTWGSSFDNPMIGFKHTYAFKCENSGSIFDKWDSSNTDCEDSPLGAVVLTQKMQKHKVVFSGNGHGANIPQTQGVLDGHRASLSSEPTETGFDFEGWFKDPACKNIWHFNKDIVSGDITLYAKWTASKIDKSSIMPIQQGNTTKVNFLPAYNGDVPPCNFYIKDADGTYTHITGITNMNSLANKIREIRPENIYTDGQGVTFYGTYNTKWRDAFKQAGCQRAIPQYDFLQSFKDSLKNNNLSYFHVYSNKSQNWDTYDEINNNECWDTPKLGDVSYEDFYNAYKLGDSTYKAGDPNLLASEVYRTWGSYFRNPDVGYKYTYAYKCENSGNSHDKWDTSHTDCDNSSVGAVVLTQVMSNNTISFSGNGHGTNLPQPQNTIHYSKAINPSTIPTDPGFDFVGWYKEPDCINWWDFNNDLVTCNITVYAKWTPKPDVSKLIPIQQGTSYKVNFLPAYNDDTPPCNFYKKESDGTYTAISGITTMNSLAFKIRDIGADKVYADTKGITFYGFYDNTTWSNAFKHENDGEEHHRYEFLDSFKTELTNHGLPTTSVYTERVRSDYVNPGNWDYHNTDTPTLDYVSIHSFWSAYKNVNVNLLGTNSWRIWSSYENTFASDDAMEYWDNDGTMEWHDNKGFENDKGSVILTKTY